MAELNYAWWSKNKPKGFKSDKLEAALKEFDKVFKQFADADKASADMTLVKSTALATQAAAKKVEVEVNALKKVATAGDGKTILYLTDYGKKLAGIEKSIVETLKKLKTPSKPTGGRGG